MAIAREQLRGCVSLGAKVHTIMEDNISEWSMLELYNKDQLPL